MTNQQAIHDVAMIARNGIDRVIELERENKRLTEYLQSANAQVGYFERELVTTNTVADNLAALVSRLAHLLRKAAPDNDLLEKALDYLKRSGMQG